MRPPRVIAARAAALICVVLALACPASAAASPRAPLNPLLRSLFPVVTRFLEAVDPAFPSGVPEPAVAEPGSVNVDVTFSIRSQAPAGTPIPIYRFYSAISGTHFYTPSAEERDMVIARWPGIWSYEGIAYWVNPAKNSQPLFRFYNVRVGSHFYTASAAERDDVIARLSSIYQYDGPTYAVTPYPETGKTPVYRFYNIKNGSHFYTADANERNDVVARLSHIYQLEGVGFWLGQ